MEVMTYHVVCIRVHNSQVLYSYYLSFITCIIGQNILCNICIFLLTAKKNHLNVNTGIDLVQNVSTLMYMYSVFLISPQGNHFVCVGLSAQIIVLLGNPLFK